MKLKDMTLRITKGTTPNSSSYGKNEVTYIKSESLNYNGIIDESKFTTIDYETHNTKLKRSILQKNDILYSIAGMNLGKVGIVDSKYLPANTNQAVAIITVNDDFIIPKYLYYYLQQQKIVSFVNSGVSQSAQPNINLAQIGNFDIELPSKGIQERIVKILDNITNRINLNNKINNNLYELAINYLNEKVEETEVPVSKFAKIQGGYAFKSKDLIDVHTKNRIIKIKNLRSEINADVINSQFVENEVVEKLDNKFRLSKGDVAIAMTGAELGKTGFIYGNDNYFLNQRVGVIRGNNKASELYLKILFLSDEFQTLLNSKGYGSAQPNVSTSDIENILINDITEDNLKKLYEIIKPIYEKIISNSEEILNLEQLRDTLLPKMMNGEIDLDNIEI